MQTTRSFCSIFCLNLDSEQCASLSLSPLSLSLSLRYTSTETHAHTHTHTHIHTGFHSIFIHNPSPFPVKSCFYTIVIPWRKIDHSLTPSAIFDLILLRSIYLVMIMRTFQCIYCSIRMRMETYSVSSWRKSRLQEKRERISVDDNNK